MAHNSLDEWRDTLAEDRQRVGTAAKGAGEKLAQQKSFASWRLSCRPLGLCLKMTPFAIV
jgi:hypothetical protein